MQSYHRSVHLYGLLLPEHRSGAQQMEVTADGCPGIGQGAAGEALASGVVKVLISDAGEHIQLLTEPASEGLR